MPLFSKDPKKCLGIDIGATSIKIIELSKEGEEISLKNYGIASIEDITGRKLRAKSEGAFSSSLSAISDTVNTILKEANIKTKRSVFSIPDFSSFFTSFEVPKMKKSEVESAIQFQARQRVPLPLNEVTLDWNLTKLRKKEGEEMVEVLLLAVPNDIIKNYRSIAKKSGLEVGSLDAETFGLARVFGEEDETIVVVDIGDQSTTVNIIEDKIPKHSHSLDISGKDFTKDIAILPEVDYNENEKDKASRVPQKIRKSLAEEMSKKIKNVCDSYERERGEEINKILVTGGGIKFEEVKRELSSTFSVVVANPFGKLNYPSVLEPIIKDLSPLCSVSIGMAMEGLRSKK
ncbi:MAG: type IV pilus assembly protein PilM [Patescibacteria group bacterium]